MINLLFNFLSTDRQLNKSLWESVFSLNLSPLTSDAPIALHRSRRRPQSSEATSTKRTRSEVHPLCNRSTSHWNNRKIAMDALNRFRYIDEQVAQIRRNMPTLTTTSLRNEQFALRNLKAQLLKLRLVLRNKIFTLNKTFNP